MVVNGDLEGDISGVRVRNIPYPNLCLKNDLENIGVCRPNLINWAMQILTEHCSWNWLTYPLRFSDRKKNVIINHCSKFPIVDPNWIEGKEVYKGIDFLKPKIS